MRPLVAVLLAGLTASAGAEASQLYSGVAHSFRIAPQSEEALIQDLTFPVIPGTLRLTIEVETDDPSPDLDLFVRFARPVVENHGVISTDFSSVTPGSGVEEIKVDSSSAPPLQTGVYYIALKVKTLGTEIAGTIIASAESGVPLTTFIISTFDNLDVEGWTRNYPESPIPGASVGDPGPPLVVDPTGFLRINELGGSLMDFAVAPPKFLGDLSLLSEARFEFDYRHHSELELAFLPLEMRIVGGGSAYRWRGPVPPHEEWIHIIAPLEEAEWTRVEGTASFTDVLRQTERIELSMDQFPLTEFNDLDNFALIGEPPLPPVGSPEGPLSSTFEGGLDGWARNYPPVGIVGATVGTPHAGVVLGSPGKDSDQFLKFVDPDGKGQDYAVAPPKYLGNLAVLDRPWIEFDYRQVEGAFARVPINVRVIGSGTVYVWREPRARSTWEHFRVPLNDDHLLRFEGTAGIAEVLASVERIEISMDLASGPEINGLDNFYLRTEFTPPVGRAMWVNRNEIMLSGSAGDPALPPQQIDVTSTGGPVMWTATVEPSSATWLTLSPAAGETPSVLELTAEPTGLSQGTHSADVVIKAEEFRVPGQTVRVTLVLAEEASTPRLNPGGVVHSVAADLPLSPGVLASLYGHNLASSGLAVSFPAGSDLLPREALGLRVLILDEDGRLIAEAPLLYVGPFQVNFQMPYEAAGHSVVQVVVVVNGVESNPETVPLAATGPGLFSLEGNRAAVLNSDFTLNSPAMPADRGSVIMAFLTGVGEIDPALQTGQAAPASPLSVVTASSSATIGGAPARIVSLVLAPGFVGLAQANIEVPLELAEGEYELVIIVDGRVSNGAIVSVR